MKEDKKYVGISLFNGIGCMWVALEKAGIKISQKVSSEIEKAPIKINNALYPETIQVGDVRKIEVIKTRGGQIQLKTEKGTIDLLDDEIILGGGSPCQSFSFAGKMKGMSTKDEIQILTLEHYLELKKSEYEFEGQSYLFWEYMRIKNELGDRVKYFLLENVIMVKKWKTVLSRAIGVNPIQINSELVSAQSRDRNYWTNIYNEPAGFFDDMECKIPQPKDKGILIKHILEKQVDEKYYLKPNQLKWWNENKDFQLKKGYSSLNAEKGITQTARQYASWNGNFVSDESQCVAMRGRNPENPKSRQAGLPTEQMIEPRNDGKTNCLTSVTKDNLIKEKENYVQWDGNGFDQDNRAYYEDGKSGTLDAKPGRQKVFLNKEPEQKQEWTIEQKNTWLYEHVCTDCRKKYIGTLSDKCPKCKKLTHTRTYEIDQKTLKRIKKSKKVKQMNPSLESGGKQPYQQNRVYDVNGIAPALCADKADLLIQGGDYRDDEGFRWRDNGKSPTLMARAREDGSGQPLVKITQTQLIIPEATKKGYVEVNPGECFDSENPNSETRRGRKMKNKSNCLMAKETDFMQYTPDFRIRRLTPKECARLQTFPEDKIDIILKCGVGDPSIYKAMGNGWNIDTVAHIFSFIEKAK